MLYSHKGKYPEQLPNRIRMPDSLTKTKPFTDQDIELAGYVPVENAPTITWYQELKWSGTEWFVVEKNPVEIWASIRKQRDTRIKDVEWRYNRYYRHERLGLPQVDSIEMLDNYVQALADITKQSDPLNITWPSMEAV
jgi:hypothetical protein